MRIIGPNGAGKTTLFNCVSGPTAVGSGRIVLDGADITGAAPEAIARTGVARTFQNLGLYPDMTVLENVMIGGYSAAPVGFWSAAFRLPLVGAGERDARDRALSLLAEIGLSDLAGRPAGGLPYGTMKRVELARALMARPRLVLLDEPAGGLTSAEVADFAGLIRDLKARHQLTVMLVEHHMKLVMALCDHIVVLHLGRTLADGRPDQVRSDPRVVAAYLGAAA